MERLFVAVWPPEHVVDELRTLRRKDQRGVRFLDPDTWHITLRFLGEAQADEVVDALDGIDVAAPLATVGPGVDVLSGRALVVPVSGLDELAGEVGRRTASLGEPRPKRFVGHLTIARLQRDAPMPAALGAFVHTTFDVPSIALVSSRLRPEGARYSTVAEWSLPLDR